MEIPYAELALGAARDQGIAEGLAAGLNTARLWARQRDEKHDAGQRLTGWATRSAAAKQPGFSLWDPDSNAPPQNTNAAGAYARLVQHMGDPELVATALAVDISSERARAASLAKVAKNPARAFARWLATAKSEGGGVAPFALRDESGGVTTLLSGEAIPFVNSRTGQRLFLARDISAAPAVTEMPAGATPIRGRLAPLARSPYDPGRVTTYVASASDSEDRSVRRLLRGALPPADADELAVALEEVQ